MIRTLFAAALLGSTLPVSASDISEIRESCEHTLTTTSLTFPHHDDLALMRLDKIASVIDRHLFDLKPLIDDPTLTSDSRSVITQCGKALEVRRIEINEARSAISAARTLVVLDAAQIVATLTGVTVNGEKDGREWSQSFAADGTTSFSSVRDISYGKWRVENNRYCSIWKGEKNWSCWRVERLGDTVNFINEKTGDAWPARL